MDWYNGEVIDELVITMLAHRGRIRIYIYFSDLELFVVSEILIVQKDPILKIRWYKKSKPQVILLLLRP